MPDTIPTALASAADTRRRELPAGCALILLTGGLAAAIMGEGFAVFWAGIMALLLITDAEIYRRLDLAEVPLNSRRMTALAVWAFFQSAFYAALPAALWLDGQAAGAAAAMVLWVAGVVRCFGMGSGAMLPVAIAGATPPALTLLIVPLTIAARTVTPDWDLAVIAAVGGGALMVYVTQARLSATEAERALRVTVASDDLDRTLGALLLANEEATVVLMRADGAVVAASRGVSRRLGIDDLTGIQFQDIVPLPKARWRDAFQRALQGENVRHSEDEVHLPAGRHWFDWETRPWRAHDGAIVGVLAIRRDVTSLVATRRVATGSHDLLRIALDAGRSVVWDVDYKTKTISWYGDCGPIYGEPFTFADFDANTVKIIPEEDRELMADYFNDIAAGEEASIEHRVVRPDGSTGWAQIWARRMLGQSGGVRRLIVMSKDITQRKMQEVAFIAAMQRAENALRAKRALFADIGDVAAEPEVTIEQSDVSLADMYEHLAGLMEEMNVRDGALADAMASLKAAREAAENASVSKSQFLASMSHELRTPLNAIIGYSEILQEEAEDAGRESDLKDLERILSSARTLLYLINDILDLSKIEAGRMDVSASDFDVRGLMEEAAETVRPSIEKNGNKLTLDLADDLGEARSDPFKLNQCVLNLLSNAAKFTKQGAIVVRVRRLGDWLDIAVTDSGIGMTGEQIARLFNPFTQAEAATAREYGGTGLGLAITRRMMQLLGGDVSVTSTPGAGSTFTLSLPAMWSESVQLSHDAGTGRVALVIDDEESARDLAQRSLSRLGFVVRSAARGRDGVHLAKSQGADVIVLDINLPDMSGWDVIETLRDTPETAAIPVIVLSINDDRQRALSLGACEHLVKPVDRDVLASVAARVARGAPNVATPQKSVSAGLPISSLKSA